MTVPRLHDIHVNISDVNADGTKRENYFENFMQMVEGSDIELRFTINTDIVLKKDAYTSGQALIENNRFINDFVKRAPGKFFGACLVNPHFLEDSLKTMEECFEQFNFVHLGEMLQYFMDYKFDSDGVEALVKKACEYDVPSLMHISTSNSKTHPSSFGNDQLEDMLRLVDRVPDAKYILAHLVGHVKDDPPIVDEYLEILQKYSSTWPDNFWVAVIHVNSPGIKSVMSAVPDNRLLIGTDYWTRQDPPYPPYGSLFSVTDEDLKDYPDEPTTQSYIDCLENFGMSQEAIERISYKNAEELYGI